MGVNHCFFADSFQWNDYVIADFQSFSISTLAGGHRSWLLEMRYLKIWKIVYVLYYEA